MENSMMSKKKKKKIRLLKGDEYFFFFFWRFYFFFGYSTYKPTLFLLFRMPTNLDDKLSWHNIKVAMRQGEAKGWGFCPRLTWFCLIPFPPRPAPPRSA